MIIGQYPDIPQGLQNPAWQRALTWAATQAPRLPDGEHEIEGRNIYANIHGTNTKAPAQCLFEMHKQYIDIHYCIEGGERIAYAPRGDLKEHTAYNEEKDYALFTPTEDCEWIAMKPGMFAIFFPDELHMPKVSDGEKERIQKVVIKILNKYIL